MSRGGGRGNRSMPPAAETKPVATSNWTPSLARGGSPKRSSQRPTTASTSAPTRSAAAAGRWLQSAGARARLRPTATRSAIPPPRGMTWLWEERGLGRSRRPQRRAPVRTSGVKASVATKGVTAARADKELTPRSIYTPDANSAEPALSDPGEGRGHGEVRDVPASGDGSARLRGLLRRVREQRGGRARPADAAEFSPSRVPVPPETPLPSLPLGTGPAPPSTEAPGHRPGSFARLRGPAMGIVSARRHRLRHELPRFAESDDDAQTLPAPALRSSVRPPLGPRPDPLEL